MRLLFVLTIATAFSLPISAQAGKGGGGGGGPKTPASNGASQQTTKATSTSVRKAGGHSPVEYVKKSTGGGTSGKVSTHPKPAAEDDHYLTLDGIKGESSDQKLK
jgi:hypothetical protein